MYDTTTNKGRQVIELRRFYENLRKKHGSYELYNLLEKCVIEVPLTPADQKMFTELDLEYLMIREIKGLAM